jgi:hypothetical protein
VTTMLEFFQTVLNDAPREYPHCGTINIFNGKWRKPEISGILKRKCNSPDCKVIDWNEFGHEYCPSRIEYDDPSYDPGEGVCDCRTYCECALNADADVNQKRVRHYFHDDELSFTADGTYCEYCLRNCQGDLNG